MTRRAMSARPYLRVCVLLRRERQGGGARRHVLLSDDELMDVPSVPSPQWKEAAAAGVNDV